MLCLLLMFHFISHGETPPVGTSLTHVEGMKGGNVTLRCEHQAKDISDLRYVRWGKSTHFSAIPACLNEEYKHDSVRVCKRGACDIILKDLTFSDPGTHFLRFNYKYSLKELKFHLLVHDEISVKTGDELNFGSLLINAERVESNSSGEWKSVWTIGKKLNDRVIVRDRNLTIRNFTASDAGAYRVLDSNETLITVTVTVTVTESGTESKKADDDHKPKDTEDNPSIIVLSVCGGLALLVLLVLLARVALGQIIFAVFQTYQRQHRNPKHGNYQDVPMQDIGQ